MRCVKGRNYAVLMVKPLCHIRVRMSSGSAHLSGVYADGACND